MSWQTDTDIADYELGHNFLVLKFWSILHH